MKQKALLQGLAATLAIAALTGCDDDFNPATKGVGGISPEVTVDSEVVRARSSRAGDVADITVQELSLTLTSADGSYANTWATVSEFPTDEKFKVGDYTLEAFYGDAETEGFECPYLHGETSLTVEENQTTTVSLTASLANAMVTVAYTDAFKEYMTDWSAEIHSAGGSFIEYAKDETRPAYVRAGAVNLNVAVTKPNGVSATLQAASFQAEARHHYTVTVDVNDGGAGKAELVITFDETLAEEEITIDISDEVLNAPAPEVTPLGFTPGTALVFVEGNAPADPVKLNVVAKGSLASITMTTHSQSLLDRGWPAEIDLLNASAGEQSTLTSLGFKGLGLWKNPEKIAVIDMSGVLAALTQVAGDNTSTFTFQVKDRYLKVSDPVTLTATIKEVKLEMSNPSKLCYDDTDLTVDVLYTGVDVADNVKIQYFNERGTWSTFDNVTFTAKEGVEDTYVALLTVPADDKDLRIKAVAGSLETPELAVNRVASTIAVSVADNDVFATHATVTVSDLSRSASTARLSLSSDGGKTYTEVAGTGPTFSLTGLTPGTEYYVRAEDEDSRSRAVTFTTEEALQLPNSGMENWYRVAGGTKYWWIDYPGTDKNTVWGTLNELTTSEGGSGTNAVNRSGASYCAFSGTRETDDTHSGSKAAIISTVGWGKGNSAYGSIGTLGKCNNLTVGELFLGSYDATNKCASYDGLAFASRPMSMVFYYKYVPKNSADWGVAEIHVYDASGNEVVQGSVNLTAASSYTQKQVELTYPSGAAKAAKVMVAFKSSGNSACQDINNDNLSSPTFGNTTDGRYTGSELYIDDIELTY